MRLHGDWTSLQLLGRNLDGLHTQRRVRPVGIVHDLLKPVVRDDIQAVDSGEANALAVRQPQAAADALLDQRARADRSETPRLTVAS
jgi:hypothetical protein